MTDDRTPTGLVRLPDLDPFIGYLPPAQLPYQVTMTDIYTMFVQDAPYRERRELLFDALKIYTSLIWTEIPYARIWVDGGFATRKDWAPPEDVDVVVVADDVPLKVKAKLASEGLLTLSAVSASIDKSNLPMIHKLRPFGGLVDAYFATSKTSALLYQYMTSVKGPDGEVIHGVRKGIAEVTRGIA
ncbi:DUF6932 family protein [Okibacterium fritillariae]|uniref:Uncharacterized protein n=1 Tax=Okibacterium fritillariae TaxID=123320 RepID=A0A1T5IEH9_9MICO|nr:hypothetical protein [Okibacterium fritillariae]SKC37423.1 hypothetical protein SAMN06309945_0319 [Okibacterium fritillariae]